MLLLFTRMKQACLIKFITFPKFSNECNELSFSRGPQDLRFLCMASEKSNYF